MGWIFEWRLLEVKGSKHLKSKATRGSLGIKASKISGLGTFMTRVHAT